MQKNSSTDKNKIIQECYDRSINLLKNNSHASGIIACARSEKAVGRHYASIFGRDAAICSLGMIASGDVEALHAAPPAELSSSIS
ncbi:MAG: hypothetical protein C4538_08500 [Nitrospiraceae bacterium]|nr:MAG: hypothetical protein C4538_08500 [Nitrospiraceae bacterium]